MRFLPKTNPLYENMAAGEIVFPAFLEKLGSGDFSGYLLCTAPGGEFYGLFARGRLLCTVSSEGGREQSGLEALERLFDTVITVGGEISVYRMIPDLVVCAHALILGTRLFNGEEVRQLDLKGVFTRLKTLGTNGVVRFYTNERSAMMFLKNGLPIGFCHDGRDSIEDSPDEVRKIAALPGARVEVCSTKTVDELMRYDLLQMVNLAKLWEAAAARKAAPQRHEAAGTPAVSADSERKLRELVDDLAEVAAAYLSRAGRALVEKSIAEQGGPAQLLDEEKRALFLSRIADDAVEIDAHARIDEMIALMRSEMATRLAAEITV